MADKGLEGWRTGVDSGYMDLVNKYKGKYSSPEYANALNELNTRTTDQYAGLGNIKPETTLGLENSTWGNIGTGLQLGTGLFNAYTGYKQLGLAEDTFNFNKDMAQKEYAMAKDAYDRQVARATSISNQINEDKVS